MGVTKIWNVDKETLLKALDTITLTPQRSGIRSSEYIRMTGHKSKVKMELASDVSGYVSVQGKGEWPFKKEIFVDRRLLIPFVVAGRDLDTKALFEFTGEGKQLIVKHNLRKATYTSSTEVQGYNNHGKDVGGKIKLDKETSKLMSLARFCAENDVASPEISCVYVKPEGKYLTVYSTTQKVVYRAKLKSSMHFKKALPFPIYILELFSNENVESVATSDKEIVVAFDNGKLWQTVAAKAQSNFPVKEIDKQFKAHPAKTAFVIEIKEFSQVIGRLASYLAPVRRLDWMAALSGKKGEKKFEIKSEVPQTSFKETLHTTEPIAYDFNIDWPLDKLEGVLTQLPASEKTMKVSFDSNGRALVRTKHIELLVPRRTK
jgi:hypothetical protein